MAPLSRPPRRLGRVVLAAVAPVVGRDGVPLGCLGGDAMQGLFCALVLAVLPQPNTPVVQHVDLVEVSHVYDDQGRKSLSQVVFWRWNGERHEVVAWRLLTCEIPGLRPRRDFERGGWVSRWREGAASVVGPVFREVRADSFRETHRQWDPERYDKEFLPANCRRGLIDP